MLRQYSVPLLLLLLSVAASACTQVDSTRLGTTGQSCARTDDCQPGLQCIGQVCVGADGDALGADGEGTVVDTTPGPPVGAWTDPLSGLTWQVTPKDEYLNFADATDFCDALVLGGLDDWRLPTISELRTLLRSCPATQPGGSCNVDDNGCLDRDCWDNSCGGCLGYLGPSVNGMYLPDEVDASKLQSWFWSSTLTSDLEDSYVWGINFNKGTVITNFVEHLANVRCVCTCQQR